VYLLLSFERGREFYQRHVTGTATPLAQPRPRGSLVTYPMTTHRIWRRWASRADTSCRLQSSLSDPCRKCLQAGIKTTLQLRIQILKWSNDNSILGVLTIYVHVKKQLIVAVVVFNFFLNTFYPNLLQLSFRT